ncbi:MAG: PLP-dependent transferase, partial [Chloroflexi bacterium]|nr:PLP-dependent transferase [Chloroflexota bacterium]
MHNLDTLTVHAGEEKKKPYGALSMPIVQTSTYAFTDTADLIAFMEDKQAGRKPDHGEYGRYGNPAQSVAEQRLAILEGAEDALLLASGMAAITSTLLTFLSAGD